MTYDYVIQDIDIGENICTYGLLEMRFETRVERNWVWSYLNPTLFPKKLIIPSSQAHTHLDFQKLPVCVALVLSPGESVQWTPVPTPPSLFLNSYFSPFPSSRVLECREMSAPVLMRNSIVGIWNWNENRSPSQSLSQSHDSLTPWRRR